MQVTVNEQLYEGESIEGFSYLLDEIDGLINAEVELSAQNGATILLLKSSKKALLFYFRDEYDDGVHSVGDEHRQGNFQIQLPHDDQLCENPLAWCIDIESAYKALSYFFVNEGEKSPYIDWQETNEINL